MLKLNMKALLKTDATSELLLTVFDGVRLSLILTDRDFRITEINRSSSQLLLYHEREIKGHNLFKLLNIPYPFSLPDGDGDSVEFHTECTRKDREQFPAKITIVSLPRGYAFVIEDITDSLKVRRRAEQRTRELNTFNALSKTLSRNFEPKEMMQDVLDTLVEVMSIDAAWLYLIEEGSGELKLCCFKDTKGGIFEDAMALKPYECFIGRVLSAGRSLLVRNAIEDPRITNLRLDEYGYKSIAGVPLVVRSIDSPRGKVVGVLGIASKIENRFSSLDMQFLTTVGNQLGVAVENARLIENLREKMRQIELINEIGSVVNSSLSIGHIFRIVVSEIKRMIDFDRASITILDSTEKRLTIFALDTFLKTELKKGKKAPVEGTSAGWVTINQKPWINRDLSKEISFPLDRALYSEGIRSTMSIPLYKDRPLGALNFDSTEPDKYSEKDLAVLMPIAKHLSIAIENALLFEEISREKREWEKTFDAITDLLWISDINGRILRANRAVTERTALSEILITQKTSADLFKLLKIEYPGEGKTGNMRKNHRLSEELKGPAGTTYHYWTYPLLDSDGRIYGYVNYLRDVTEQKRLQEQLIRSDKLASLGTLVAGIAHEINNPLGIIAGYSEALLDRAREPDLAQVEAFRDFPEYLDTINKEIFRCKGILQSLLDFARPSTGTQRQIDINELIKEVILLVNYRAKKHHHTIELALDRDIPKTKVDPGAMRQLFMNIIMNSFYFMDTAGRIRIATSFEPSESMIKIIISDNGKGIDPSIINRIFDPFFTTKPVGEGTGLGLAICHRIVTEHDGSMDVSSELGSGTTFTIKIPVKQ